MQPWQGLEHRSPVGLWLFLLLQETPRMFPRNSSMPATFQDKLSPAFHAGEAMEWRAGIDKKGFKPRRNSSRCFGSNVCSGKDWVIKRNTQLKISLMTPYFVLISFVKSRSFSSFSSFPSKWEAQISVNRSPFNHQTFSNG